MEYYFFSKYRLLEIHFFYYNDFYRSKILKEYVKRYVDLDRILDRKSVFLIGPRMCGKSMYAKNEVRKPVLYWNLLSNTLYYRIIRNPALLEETLKAENLTEGLVVIDEIQRAPQLLYTVHQFIEDTDLVFLMTGSSVRKLKTGGVNLLGGRALEKKLHPLCYPEIKDRGDYTLERIFKTGLLPEMYLYPEDADEVLAAYEGLYLETEIQLENEVNDLPGFINFLEKAALSNGQQINFSAFASDVGVSRQAIKTWYKILLDTFMVKEIKPYGKTKKRKETSFSRFYFFDVGIARSLAHMTVPTETMTEYGTLFETYIAMELIAYIDYAGIHNTDLTYYRTSDGKREVDFIIGDKIAIEVKSTKSVTDRHLANLRELKEEGIFSKYIVVSREESSRMLDDGILILPWKDFLGRLWNGDIITKQ